jgi:hypothetical protein
MRLETENESDKVEINMSDTIESPDDLVGLNLPPEQITLRDRFVEQYVIDYDAVAATRRLGYPGDFARDIAVKFIHCPYVNRQVQKFEDAQDVNGNLDQEQRRLIAALRKEAAYYGPGSSHAARVAALGKLASLRKMDQPVKVDVTNRGGVMVVPGIVSLDNWEADAVASQEALTKHAAD